MSQRPATTLGPALGQLPKVGMVRLGLTLLVAAVPLAISPWWRQAPWHPVAASSLHLLFVGLATVALGSGLSRLDLPMERRFWSLLAAGLACRGVAELVTTLGLAGIGPGSGLLAELLHGAAFTLLLIALDHRPHVLQRRDAGSGDSSLSPLLLILLVAGYLLYFRLLPLLTQGGEADLPLPSTPFHLALELLATLWLAMLWHTAATARWKGLYGLLLLSSALAAGGHGLLLASLRSPSTLLATASAVVALVSMVVLVLAAALRHRRFTHQAEPTSENEPALEAPARVGLRTLYLAITFPCLHLILHAAGLLDETLRTSRELVVAAWLPPLALVALWRHLMLRRYSRQQLERRARLSSALQQSQANLRLLHQKQETTLEQRRAEDRFVTFFRMSPTGLLIANLDDGEVLEVNSTLESILGSLAEELVGRPLTELGLWRDPTTATTLLERVRNGDFPHRLATSMRARRGWHDMLLSATALDLGPGDGLLMVVRDIDDQRRAAGHLAERVGWREMAEEQSRELVARRPDAPR